MFHKIFSLLLKEYGFPDSSPVTPSVNILIHSFNHSTCKNRRSSTPWMNLYTRFPQHKKRASTTIDYLHHSTKHNTANTSTSTSYRTPKNWTPIQVSRTAGCQLPELPLHRHHGLYIQKNLISFFNAHPSSTCDLFNNVRRHHHSSPSQSLSSLTSSRTFSTFSFRTTK